MKQLIKITLASGLLIVTGTAVAADAEAGKAKAAACSGCHLPGNPMAPVLDGMPEQYLIKATRAYANGERNDASMKAFVSALSDADVENLAAFYATQKCK